MDFLLRMIPYHRRPIIGICQERTGKRDVSPDSFAMREDDLNRWKKGFNKEEHHPIDLDVLATMRFLYICAVWGKKASANLNFARLDVKHSILGWDDGRHIYVVPGSTLYHEKECASFNNKSKENICSCWNLGGCNVLPSRRCQGNCCVRG